MTSEKQKSVRVADPNECNWSLSVKSTQRKVNNETKGAMVLKSRKATPTCSLAISSSYESLQRGSLERVVNKH